MQQKCAHNVAITAASQINASELQTLFAESELTVGEQHGWLLTTTHTWIHV